MLSECDLLMLICLESIQQIILDDHPELRKFEKHFNTPTRTVLFINSEDFN